VGRLGKMRKFAGMMLTVLTAMAGTHSMQGAVAYLPCIGPSPLRFEPMADPGASLAWKSLRPLPPPAQIMEAMTNATNDVVIKESSTPNTNNTIVAASAPTAVPVEANNSGSAANPVILPASSDDSSSPVTAQILAGFFKPSAGGKNTTGNAVILPTQLGFTPPSPNSAPESKAVYKSQ